MAGILAKSSNTGSIMAAELVGEEKFREYLTRFGMGATTGSGFPGEAAGYVPPLNAWTDSTFPTLSFGQGFSTSALGITSVFQTIANGGVRIQPTLVESLIGPDGREQSIETPSTERVVSEETAHDVLRMMEGVSTQEGTAAEVSVPGYRIAGKTGTANRIDDSCGCYRGYTSSFIGLAPADDPELIVAVFLQDPKTDYRGSATGVPVFNPVMSGALQMRGVKPTGVQEAPLPIYAPGSSPSGENG
jgi:cell division protein FtsI (penicillin-binding protein 3)